MFSFRCSFVVACILLQCVSVQKADMGEDENVALTQRPNAVRRELPDIAIGVCCELQFAQAALFLCKLVFPDLGTVLTCLLILVQVCTRYCTYFT